MRRMTAARLGKMPTTALRRARRRPQAGLVHSNDRGTQYTSIAFGLPKEISSASHSRRASEAVNTRFILSAILFSTYLGLLRSFGKYFAAHSSLSERATSIRRDDEWTLAPFSEDPIGHATAQFSRR